MKQPRILLALAAATLSATAFAAPFTVTTAADSGPGSLRQAITDANNSAGLDTIVFAIPGGGVHTITPASQLPTITSPVVIDGYTQPGASVNTLANGDNAVILIELSGATLGNNGNGLDIFNGGSGSTVRGLAIDFGWSAGILLSDSSNNHVEGCFVGVDPAGAVAHGNTVGLLIDFGGNSSSNTFGGTTPAVRNLVSSNNTNVFVRSGTNNVIQGNFIGTDATGTKAVGLFSGQGVELRSNNNLVGGNTAAARNVIAGVAGSSGVVIGFDVAAATGNKIQGNFIGTDVTGTKPLGFTGSNAIFLNSFSTNTLIGGLTSTPGAAPGNVISASGTGIFIQQAVAGNTVQGNLIGTNAAGTAALGNSLDGMNIQGPSNVIGGTSATARNVISGNGRHGILVGTNNASVHDNLIQGNFIGPDVTGTKLLGNAGDGVQVIDSTQNTIGGPVTTSGAPPGNVIAGNAVGVSVVGNTTGVRIQGNSIYANAQLGIDLTRDAVTLNDAGDGDSGPNNLQNFPVITSVANAAGNTTITGTLNSTANTAFRLEFFSNSALDASGFGQGENFIGSTNVTTDGSGNGSFNVTFPESADGLYFSATATDPTGNTSEFSASPAATGLVIINASSVTARTGQPFSFQLITTGGTATQRLSTSGLPAGLTANPVTGVISGTPAADGTFNVIVTITDGAVSVSATLQLTFTSDAGLPVIISPFLANVVRGQSFSYQINAPANAGPSDATTFSIVGTLPPGLGLDPVAGTISGTVLAVRAERGGGVKSAPLSGGALLTTIQMAATNSHGTGTAPLTLLLQPPTRALNISTRLAVGTNENVLIGGIIVTGNAPKLVILRAIGPSLGGNGVAGALGDPLLELHRADGSLLLANDNWRTDQEADILQTTIPPPNDKEPAIVAVLPPAAYTAVVRGSDGGTGIALVEAYDLGTASMDLGSSAQLANISTRGFVSTGNNVMIGGFIAANAAGRFLIRAIGPSLAGQGVPNALPDTLLELHDGNGGTLMTNDNWKDTQQTEITATGVPPTDDRESAMVPTLAPGNYTAVVRGKNSTTGVGLVEVYNLQ